VPVDNFVLIVTRLIPRRMGSRSRSPAAYLIAHEHLDSITTHVVGYDLRRCSRFRRELDRRPAPDPVAAIRQAGNAEDEATRLKILRDLRAPRRSIRSSPRISIG